MPSLIRSAALLSVAALATACTCRSDYDLVAPQERPPEGDWGQWLSMDTTPDGRIAMTYYATEREQIRFATGTPKADGTVSWEHEDVDGHAQDGLNPGDRGKFGSMVVSPDGTVWASYHDAALGQLRVAHRLSPDNWEHEMADAGGGFAPVYGMWTSIDLDAENAPVVAHYDGDRKELRVVHYEDGDWSAETIDEGDDFVTTDPETGEPVTVEADVGQFARLLIHENTEFIAYYDAAQGDLKLAEGFAGTYTTSVVYSEGDVGQWPSIWTDGTTLAIAFHDVTNQDLVLGTRTNGQWTFEVVDDGDFMGADTEVVWKGDDFAVVYFDGHNNDMRMASRVGGTWETERLGGSNEAVGFHNEIVQAGDGTWWAGSFDYTNRTVFVRPVQ